MTGADDGLTRLGRWLRDLDVARPWILDGLVPAVVVVFMGVPDLLDPDERGWHVTPGAPVTVTLLVALALPLFWRRRHPVAVFFTILAVFGLHAAAGIVLQADTALLIAIYNLALRARARPLAWAAGATAVVVAGFTARVSDQAPPVAVALLMTMIVIGPAALGSAARLRRAQLAALREQADQRARLATATERNRIAREMHDVLGHNLSVIITLADGGAYASTTHPDQGARALRLIAGAGRQALSDLRHVLGRLDAELTPQPGLAALGALCDQIRAAGPEVTYRSSGDLDDWDEGLQLTAYRIVQEAMTNSLRHAGPATRVDLRLEAEPGGLRLTVRDTGGHATTLGGPGHGLIGMRERAAIYQGSLTAGPQTGGGWAVTTVLRERA